MARFRRRGNKTRRSGKRRGSKRISSYRQARGGIRL